MVTVTQAKRKQLMAWQRLGNRASLDFNLSLHFLPNNNFILVISTLNNALIAFQMHISFLDLCLIRRMRHSEAILKCENGQDFLPGITMFQVSTGKRLSTTHLFYRADQSGRKSLNGNETAAD
jgi:hypothetical protein